MSFWSVCCEYCPCAVLYKIFKTAKRKRQIVVIHKRRVNTLLFPCSIPFYCQLLKSCVHKNPSCSWRILYRDTYTHTAQSCTKVVFFLSVKSLHHRILMILSFRVRYKTQACEQIYVTCLNRSRYLHSHSITSIICGLASFFEYFYNFVVVVYLHSSIFIYWSISVRKFASVEYFSIII